MKYSFNCEMQPWILLCFLIFFSIFFLDQREWVLGIFHIIIEWVRLEKTSEIIEFNLFGSEGSTCWSEGAKNNLCSLGETSKIREAAQAVPELCCHSRAWFPLQLSRGSRGPRFVPEFGQGGNLSRSSNKRGVLEVGKQSHPSAFWGKSHNVEHGETELRA